MWAPAVAVQGFLVKATKPSVELFPPTHTLSFCSLESFPCVLFSIQKFVSMSESLQFPELCKQSNGPSHPVHLFLCFNC